jgi:uncharacterized membrane protein YeaQ/YmgE (transglycosylase-associated protein family)
MSILWTIIIGLVAGVIAKFLMPGRDPGGFIVTILLGIAGAFVANLLGQSLGMVDQKHAGAALAGHGGAHHAGRTGTDDHHIPACGSAAHRAPSVFRRSLASLRTERGTPDEKRSVFS